MQDHNCLIIKPNPNDYIRGVNSPLALKPVLPSGNWLPYTEYYERQQLANGQDTDGCVCFAAQESFDAQVERLIQSGQVSQQTINWMTSLGYMDTGLDGKPHFHTSPRFLQIMTGNRYNGNAITDAWNVLRNYGALPYKDLPVSDDLTLDTYLTGLTQVMKDKALQFLIGIGGKKAIQYEWVTDGRENLQAMSAALPTAPLCVGVVTTDGWNQTLPTPPASGANPNHCVMNYEIDQFKGVWIYDHYQPNPKDLVNYPVWYALQAVVTITPPPPAPVPPANPTVPQTLNWLQQLVVWLKNKIALMDGLKGRILKEIQK